MWSLIRSIFVSHLLAHYLGGSTGAFVGARLLRRTPILEGKVVLEDLKKPDLPDIIIEDPGPKSISDRLGVVDCHTENGVGCAKVGGEGVRSEVINPSNHELSDEQYKEKEEAILSEVDAKKFTQEYSDWKNLKVKTSVSDKTPSRVDRTMRYFDIIAANFEAWVSELASEGEKMIAGRASEGLKDSFRLNPEEYEAQVKEEQMREYEGDLTLRTPPAEEIFRMDPAQLAKELRKEHYARFDSLVEHTLNMPQKRVCRERLVELVPRLMNILVTGDRDFKQIQDALVNVIESSLKLESGPILSLEGYAILHVLYRTMNEVGSLPKKTFGDLWNLAKLQDLGTRELLGLLDQSLTPIKSELRPLEFHRTIAAIDHAIGRYDLDRKAEPASFLFGFSHRQHTVHETLSSGFLWLSTMAYNPKFTPLERDQIAAMWIGASSGKPLLQEFNQFRHNLLLTIQDNINLKSPMSYKTDDEILGEIASRTVFFCSDLTNRIWWEDSLAPAHRITIEKAAELLTVLTQLYAKFDRRMLTTHFEPVSP